jgi:hypothetical protein
MKNQLLKTPVLILYLILIFSRFSEAQIVYTDINPDITINAMDSIYHLDLNNYGINDYLIRIYSVSTPSMCGSHGYNTNHYIRILSLDSNAVLDGSTLNPQALYVNTLIDFNAQFWNYDSLQSLVAQTSICRNTGVHTCCGGLRPYGFCCHDTWSWWGYSYSGTWNQLSDKFLGLKFHAGGNNYYGWLRMSTSGLSVTIKDYAYNSNPFQTILAGDNGFGSTGIIENNRKYFSVYSFNKILFIDINENTNAQGTLSVFDIMGHQIKKIVILNPQIKVDMNDFENGIYIITMQTNGEMETGKIYLK